MAGSCPFPTYVCTPWVAGPEILGPWARVIGRTRFRTGPRELYEIHQACGPGSLGMICLVRCRWRRWKHYEQLEEAYASIVLRRSCTLTVWARDACGRCISGSATTEQTVRRRVRRVLRWAELGRTRQYTEVVIGPYLDIYLASVDLAWLCARSPPRPGPYTWW